MTYKIYSIRYSAAKGKHWQEERSCAEDNVQAWLAVFRGDEPGVLFIASKRRPAKP